MFSSTIERFHEKRRVIGEGGEDAGFTLIELMVVLLILAILLAIAIPTFLGVTKSANDRAAQSNVNTAYTNVKALYQQFGQSYVNPNQAGFNSASMVTSLSAAEPSLSFTTGASTKTSQVSVFVSSDGNGVVLADYSPNSKNCWIFVDVPTSITANGPFAAAAAPASGTAGTASPGTAITFNENTTGDVYAEIKGLTTANNSGCTASAPVDLGTGAIYQTGTGSYPS